jgi:HD-GYP domain-containing protein (c-di-GMP phosphodiesterase class II)
MQDYSADPKHFTLAATELGERKPVIASRAIYNTKGVKLIEKGVAISLRQYERLQEHKLSAPLEESLQSELSVSGLTLRENAEEIIQNIPFFGRMLADDRTRRAILRAIEMTPLSAPMVFQLTVAQDMRTGVFQHLLRTALIAGWLARSPLKSRYDLETAVAAGLLHDVGMLHVDPILQQPEQQLDREQRRQLYAHPLVSSQVLERTRDYGPDVVRAVGEHQEYLDGSGYPRHLEGKAISVLGRILSLAQVVSAMFSYERAAPEVRLSVLLRMTTHRFEEAMTMQILSQLQPHRDVLSAPINRLSNATHLLCQIDELLLEWPLAIENKDELTPERRSALIILAKHADQIRRALAGIGAAPAQLAKLGEDLEDDAVQIELTLMTHEAAWQLRTMARQARRRWAAQPDEPFPTPLAKWLQKVDNLVSAIYDATEMQ